MPQALFVQDGRLVDIIPTSQVVAGEVVVRGTLVGIASKAIAANTLGTLTIEGIIEVNVEVLGSWQVGMKAYWNESEGWASPIPEDGPFMGKCIQLLSPLISRILVRLSHA